MPETRESYYVTMRSVGSDYRRTERYWADNFADAETQAIEDILPGEEIIQIERDYKI